jgi:hypothetical protein
MDNLTPAQKVRLQLEKSLTQDAIARARRIKRESTSILPTFMGTNGNIKRLGHGESRAAIATNIQYVKGEEMRPIPVSGGLPMVDNKPRIAPPIPPAPEPPTPPTDKRFQVGLNIGVSVSMYTGSASSIDTPDAIAPIPYNENGFYLPDPFEANKGIFLPGGTTLADEIEIAPGIFDNVTLGSTTLGELAPYFPDPYQFFQITLACASSYTLQLEAYLYQEGIDPYFYPDSVISETWLAIGDIVDESSFSLIYTYTHGSIPSFGSGGENLIPFTYTAGDGGTSLTCDDPSGLTYTFFVRFKEVSKSNWFEL